MTTSIDELYFDDVEELDKDILKNCFPVYHLPVDSNDLFDSGTGFLINNDGIFLSAGHVFFKETDTYKAYYDNNEYKVECIYKEYDDESGKDLFIGKLIDLKKELSHHVILANSDLIEIGDEFFFAGFNTQMSVLGEMTSTGIQIQHSGHTFYGHVLAAKLVSSQNKERYRIIADKRLTLSSMKVLSNVPHLTYRGISGGPVFYKNRIYGIFLSDVFVTSNYIKDCLNKVNIKRV